MGLIIDSYLKEECARLSQSNIENLMMLLRDNADTEYGKRYHFSEIQDVDSYRKKVPLTEYEDYADFVERMFRGEKNILTAYRLVGYSHTSGTSKNGMKRIPVTDKELEMYGNGYDEYTDSILRENGGKRLFLATFRTKPGEWDDLLLFTELYYRTKYEKGRMDIAQYVGGEELLFSREDGDMYFAKCFAALCEEKITVVEAIFLYDHLHFFNYLEENWEKVAKAIRAHEIPDDVVLPETMKKKLLSIEVSEERIDKIESECLQGFDGIVKRLWPGMRLLSGISSEAFFAEDQSLDRYAGDVPRYYYVYCASEGYMGNPVAENDFRYVLMPNTGFFEFIPYDTSSVSSPEVMTQGQDDSEDNTQPATLLPQELIPGNLYEVVVTNLAGLYRYRMGDIIRVEEFYGESPVYEFVMRRNLAISVAGEKVGVPQLEHAIRLLREEHDVNVSMFCFAANTKKIPARYSVVLSVDGEEDGSAGEGTSRDDRLAAWIDENIRRQNPDYDDLRKLGELAFPEVFRMDADTYVAFMEANGLFSGHNKPKHVAPGGFSAL